MKSDRLEAARVNMLELLALNDEEREHLQRALDSLENASGPTAPSSALADLNGLTGVERPIRKGQLRRLFLAEVARSPGITVSQASLRLEATREALNPVVKQVLREKLVAKNGAGYSLYKPKHKASEAEADPFNALDGGEGIGIPLGSGGVAHRPPRRPAGPFVERVSPLKAEEAP